MIPSVLFFCLLLFPVDIETMASEELLSFFSLSAYLSPVSHHVRLSRWGIFGH